MWIWWADACTSCSAFNLAAEHDYQEEDVGMYIPSSPQLTIAFSGLLHLKTGREREQNSTFIATWPLDKQEQTEQNMQQVRAAVPAGSVHTLLYAPWAFGREFSHRDICITHQKESITK